MRVAHWGLAGADAPEHKEYSVRLMGGEALRMRLEAADLSAVSEQLRRERALVGHLIIEEDGYPSIVEALVPSHRIQLVLADAG